MEKNNSKRETGPVVKVEHLTKTYGSVKAIDDISFEVRQGEIFGMLGPNGAGKTTTVEIIEGLRVADSGRVSVLGLDIAKAPARIKQQIGVQLEAPSLLPLLTVEETLDLFAGFYQHSFPVDNMLEMLELKDSRGVLVKNLSGGQQQRLSVAMALINDPDLAFLDEPTASLDPQARRNLWTIIEAMRNRQKTVFLTTHYMEEAERLCNRVAIIDYGKIISLGSPQDLICEHFKEKAIQFELEPTPSQAVLQDFPGTTNAIVSGNEVLVYSNDIPTTMSAILRYTDEMKLTGRLKDLHVREATLEDVFLKLTGRKIRE
jgi:ABC-2 type transport system ATP-binding protein